MRHTAPLRRRGNLRYWRRRLPGAGCGRCIDLFLDVKGRVPARRMGALMDAAFEQLVDRETGPAAAPVSEAAVMRAVQDEVVRRAAGARRRRGPDPVQPTRGPTAEAPLPDAVAGPLAAFLAGGSATRTSRWRSRPIWLLPCSRPRLPSPPPPACRHVLPPPGSGPSPPWGAPPFFGAR
jgi:hypothetical protein